MKYIAAINITHNGCVTAEGDLIEFDDGDPAASALLRDGLIRAVTQREAAGGAAANRAEQPYSPPLRKRRQRPNVAAAGKQDDE